jgi:hypothetical protein
MHWLPNVKAMKTPLQNTNAPGRTTAPRETSPPKRLLLESFQRFLSQHDRVTPVFYQSPDEYRAETMSISLFWWVFCPIAATAALWAFAYLDPVIYARVQGEDAGILEFLHAAVPLATAAIAARLLFMEQLRRDPLIALWLLLLVLGGVYLGGEEASWGQHYFGWTTPESWAEINRQRETNLHNTSFWLDRFPRVVCTVAIIIGGWLLPFVKLRYSKLIPERLDFIVPPLALCVLTGVLVAGEIFGITKEYTDALDDMMRFRSGEMQENFIVSFIFFYAIFLRTRAFRTTASEYAKGRKLAA